MPSSFQKAQIIGGAFQDPSGNPLSNGYLTFVLSHDSNVAVLGGPTGAQVVAGIQIKFLLDNVGNLVSGQFLWTNDALTPAGSYYRVTAFNSQGIQVWANPQNFFIQPYAATINIGTIQPNVP
jgi:hypothetical protein